MVAVEGDLQLPAIRSLSDLKLAMSKLGSVSANDVLAVEVFWTPQVRWVGKVGIWDNLCMQGGGSGLGSVSANDVLAVEVFWTPQVRSGCRNGRMGAQC